MRDLVLLLLIAGFFTLVVAYLKGCEAIVGTDDTLLRATEPRGTSPVGDRSEEVSL